MTTARLATTRTLTDLQQLVHSLAASPNEWMPRVRLRSDERWFECIERTEDYDIWLISWLPGQATGFHDHGESSGAFAVAMGALQEHRPGVDPLTIIAGETRGFGARYAHDVRNGSTAPAVSIHAYSPPLVTMNRYELAGERLVPVSEDESRQDRPRAFERPAAVADIIREPPPPGAGVRRTIAEVMRIARARLQRLSPRQAQDAVDQGALLVDIRPAAQRAAEGNIPNALIVERNVLEWRFDPMSDARLPEATGYDVALIVVCSEGYTSSLAAAALQDLGLSRATDVIGGFKAWRAAGLPVVRRQERRGS